MKRLLALDGGGLRGMIEVAFLERLEQLVRERRGPDTRLSDVFDLVGGTSTGSILATSVAIGLTVEEMKPFYVDRALRVFKSSFLRPFGLIAAYSGKKLEDQFREVVGSTSLGDPEVKTLLAMVLKRVDTGAPWVVSNLPEAPFFEDPEDGSYIGNRHFELARLMRASAAAPGYFSPVKIQIHKDGPDGIFVDGGLSPYNDPSLALLKLARMKAFGLNWPTGPDKLAIVSVGCGRSRRVITEQTAKRSPQLAMAGLALLGMMQDAEAQSLTMMQWLGTSLAPVHVNSELKDMTDECLAPEPLFSYLRLDFPMSIEGLAELGFDYDEKGVARLKEIDDPSTVPELFEIGRRAAEKMIGPDQLDAIGL